MHPARLYQEKDAPGWKILTRNYWIGRNPHMKTFLEWIEQHADDEITEAEVKSAMDGTGETKLMVDIDLVEASHQMWSYLNLNLTGDIVEVFQNVDLLNGAEA